MTTVGAIRWDAWYADTGPAASTASAFMDPDVLYRAPFFAAVEGRRVRYRPTQATMDREIEHAASAGLYWAFLHYGETDPNVRDMNNGFTLFQSSAHKNDVNWCSILEPIFVANQGVAPSTAYQSRVAQIVAWMAQPNYQTVLSSRPLVYLLMTPGQLETWWGTDAAYKVAIDALRAAAIAASLQDPYIVVLQAGGASAESRRVALGADAISSYIGPIPSGLNKTYASLAASAEAFWTEMATASDAIVPIVMCGWNRKPRIARPMPWETETQRPYFRANVVHADPTTQELVNHFASALAYVAANPSECDADTILAYAWNEFDEGGWLCPTLGDPNGERLAAVGAVINGQ